MNKRRKKSKAYPEQCCSIEELPDIVDGASAHVQRTIFCFLLRIDFNNTTYNKPDFFYVTDFTSNEQIRRPLLPKLHFINGYTIEDNQVFQMDVLRWRIGVLLEEYDQKYGTVLSNNLDNVNEGNVNIVRIENQLMLLKVGIVLKSYRGTLECRTIGMDLIDYYDEPIVHQQYIRKLYSNLTSKLPQYYFAKLRDFVKLVIPNDYLTNVDSIDSSDSNERAIQAQVKLEQNTSFVEDIEFEDDYISSPKEAAAAATAATAATSPFTSLGTESPATITPAGTAVIAATYTICQLNSLNPDSNKIYTVNGYIIHNNLNQVCVKSYDPTTLDLQDPILRELELVITQESKGIINQHNSLSIYITPQELLDFFQLSKIEQLYINVDTLYQKLMTLHEKRLPLKLIRTPININNHEYTKVWSLYNQTFDQLVNS